MNNSEHQLAQAKAEAVAWMTHHDTPMLFPTREEAAQYCDDDEEPIPLFEHPSGNTDALVEEIAKAVEHEWYANVGAWMNQGRRIGPELRRVLTSLLTTYTKDR